MIDPKLKLSVIICCYRGAKTIEACLNSLINQSKDNILFELIIVDDGSRDGTADIIKAFLEKNQEITNPQIKCFRKVNEGLSVARNYGVEKANSEWIAYIDEDAVADKDWVKNIVREFAESDTPQIIGGPVHLLNKESKTASLLYNSIYSFETKPECAIIGTNMAFSRTLLLDSPAFHPSLIGRGDESYVFYKIRSKYNIVPRKVDSIIVDHKFPESLRAWLKTRYENGYYSVVIANLFKNDKSLYSYKKLFAGFISLSLPFLILLSVIIYRDLLISFSLLILFLLLLVKRFIISGFTQKVVKEYYMNTKKKKKISMILYLFYITVIGTLGVEYGYLKASIKFKLK